MAKKKFDLKYNWVLRVEEDYSVFIDLEDSENYSVFDEDDQHLFTLFLEKDGFQFHSNYDEVDYSVNFKEKTITVLGMEDLF